jgi:structural maintenance of chromosome 1
MDAFNHISSNIDKIYKQLTKSNTHPLGGTAYLNLENEDDPFLHGIKYTAMPPTKRFRDMEQLSGGEKTVAALALLFSIHRYTLEEHSSFYLSQMHNMPVQADMYAHAHNEYFEVL